MSESPRPSRLVAGRTALLVVDMQEKLLRAIHEGSRLREKVVLLLRAAEALSVPVILTTQYAKGLGPTAPEVLAAAPGVAPLDKLTFGCFGCEAFLFRLRALPECRQLLVAGVESHICVTQTVLDALGAGYEVHVVTDATGSRTDENKRLGLRRMERAGAVLSSTEMAAYELMQRSDAPSFKAVLPLLK